MDGNGGENFEDPEGRDELGTCLLFEEDSEAVMLPSGDIGSLRFVPRTGGHAPFAGVFIESDSGLLNTMRRTGCLWRAPPKGPSINLGTGRAFSGRGGESVSEEPSKMLFEGFVVWRGKGGGGVVDSKKPESAVVVMPSELPRGTRLRSEEEVPAVGCFLERGVRYEFVL